MILTSDYILIITNGFPVELYPEVQLTGFKMSSSSQPTRQTECKQSGMSLVIQEYQPKTETNKHKQTILISASFHSLLSCHLLAN